MVMLKRIIITVVCLIGFLLVLPLGAQDPPLENDQDWLLAGESWPREVERNSVIYRVHKPQLESWDGYRLKARAAFSVQESKEEEPAYGAFWIEAKTRVDKEVRLVVLENMTVTRILFPADPERESRYREAIENQLVDKTRVIPLDHLESELAILEAEKKADTFPLKNDPPRIVIRDAPAMLVFIDGKPVFRDFEDTSLERVINTKVLILKERDLFFLRLFDGWMESASLTGSWSVSKSPPGELAQALEWARESRIVDLLEGVSDPENEVEKPSLSKGPVPEIVVATEPTELLVTDGEPKYVSIEGTSLSYVENTTGHIFRHSSQNRIYILVSGRWFHAENLDGPWTFIKGGHLPPDFADIPDDSKKENVKACIPGTPQATEAVIAATVPLTAEVKRTEAKITKPSFDGPAQFQKIDGTSLRYAVNTPTPILQSGENYYAVENGVWFTTKDLKGEWQLATSVPAEIYSIPPSEPLHYVTYVKIYEVNDESVVVGYTPGYNGSVITTGSGAIVVYGTGYHYHPWVGTVYYGPPVSYGFGVSMTYTPWTGWCYGFGFGWYWGPAHVTVGWGWGPYPWYGPVGWMYYPPYPYYRPPYGYAWGPRGVAAVGPGGWAATTGNVYQRWGDTTAVTRRSGGYNAWTGNRWANQVGTSYNSRTGNLAAGQRAAVGNVYTGDYAYGRRGVVTDTDTGITARGGQVTVGNTRTGNSATAGRVTVTNPNTGNMGSIGAVKGEQGSAVRVGDNVYAGKNGEVYKRGDSGWQQVDRSGDWATIQDRSRTQSLDRQQYSRQQSSQRYQGYRSGAYRSAGGMGARGRRR